MSLFPISEGLEIEGTITSPGKVDLTDSTNYVTIQAPVGMTSSYTLTLPLTLGTTGNVFTMISSSASGWANIGEYSKIWTISDEKPAGVGGGTLPTASWVIRTLNVIVPSTYADSSVQLAVAPAGTNELLIQPGKYKIYAVVPAYNVRGHRGTLANLDTLTDIVLGTSTWTRNATNVSIIEGIFTLALQTRVAVLSYASIPPGNINDGGRAAGVPSINELYTKVIIEQI